MAACLGTSYTVVCCLGDALLWSAAPIARPTTTPNNTPAACFNMAACPFSEGSTEVERGCVILPFAGTLFLVSIALGMKTL